MIMADCATVAVCHDIDSSSKHAAFDLQPNALLDPTVEAVNAVSLLLRRASTTDHNRRLILRRKGKSIDMPSSSKGSSISPEEYEKLPSSIQRKYFSSEERYQIAQRSAADKRQRQPSRECETWSAAVSRATAKDDTPKRRKTLRKVDTKNSRRSSLPSAFEGEAQQGEAAWFDGLPEKVKRSQFSDQERSALAVPSAYEAVERPQTSSSHKPSFDLFCWDKLRSASSETPQVTRSPCTTPSLQPRSPTPSFAPSASSDSHTPQVHGHTQRYLPSAATSPSLVLPKIRTPENDRMASRRAFLLQPIPLPPPVLAPLSTLPSPDTYKQINRAEQLDEIIVQNNADTESTDADITPTQEMETAQKKLKNLPPAWYDEKLDFGFEHSDARKPSTSTFDSWEQPRTLSPSISDTASSHSPVTPISPALHATLGFDLPRHTILDQPRPSSLQHTLEHGRDVTNFSHRQHTSQRGSSDRPLRTGRKHLVDGFYEEQDSIQPYSITIHYDNHDPLALEALPVCDDPTGAHGAFAVPADHAASGFRKVLKVIRGH